MKSTLPPLNHYFDDPWEMLRAACEEVAFLGAAHATVEPDLDPMRRQAGLRIRRLDGKETRFLVDEKRLYEAKPQDMPDNVWVALRSSLELGNLAAVVGRGVPREALQWALPGICVHNPAGISRLNLPK